MSLENKEVIELIKYRTKGIKDTRKLGLFLPGGGLRGAFSGGAMVALEELGLCDVFDVIYGFSAGAFSGAYLLSEDTKKGNSIYYEDLSKKRFIQPWRFTKTMNMDYFCDEVVAKKKDINLEKIKNSKTILKIFITNVETGKREYFTSKDGGDLRKALRASCSYPGLSKPITEINGQGYVDGNAKELIPLKEAVKDGCTDILVISTVPENYIEKTIDPIHGASKLFTRKYPKKFRAEMKDRVALYNRDLDYVFGRKKLDESLHIYTIAPDYGISPGQDSERKLKEYSVHGTIKTKEAFDSLST